MTASERFEIESLEDFADFAYEQGWTDGLPIFPPTRSRVAGIVEYLAPRSQEVLGTIFPADGVATIENIAANCAMAGCLPEHVPVVLAAVEVHRRSRNADHDDAIDRVGVDPHDRHRPASWSELGFHTREWIFGPNGGRANAAIGRAIRLILWNIGRAHPGKLIKGTMGHPASWSYCIGEEQELTPWEPMHVDCGIAAAESAVTVMKAGEHSQVAVPINTVGLNECITLLARGIGRVGITTSGGKRGFVFVINPSLAQSFAQRRVYAREIAQRHCRARVQVFVRLAERRQAGRIGRRSTIRIRACRANGGSWSRRWRPTRSHVVVGGGVAPQMGQCVAISSRSSAGEPMLTKAIRFSE